MLDALRKIFHPEFSEEEQKDFLRKIAAHYQIPLEEVEKTSSLEERRNLLHKYAPHAMR